MATTVTSLKELVQRAESLGLHPKVQPGDVFWVENRVLKRYTLSFRHMPEENYHAVVVVSVGSRNANTRVMTSKVQRYHQDGILYIPAPEVALRRPGIVLTRKPLRRRVPLAALVQTEYLGNVGLATLRRIRCHEQGLGDEEADPALVEADIPPQERDSRKDEQLVDQLLNCLHFNAA